MTTAMKPIETFKPEEYQKPQSLDVLKKMGRSIESAIADALPGFMRAQSKPMLRALYTEVQKNPSLMNCTPQSLFGCTIQTGQLGLMLGSGLGQAFLIPFKRAATLVIGYKGYVQLVNRSGQVGVISAYTVYDGDKFSVSLGSSPKLIHEPGNYPDLASVQSRKAVAYYSVCQTRNGPVFHVLTRPEAEYHKTRFAMNKREGSPWDIHFDSMAMKTAIIKLCKYLPMSAEVQTAIRIDESSETDTPHDASFLFSDAIEANEEEPESTTSKLRGRLSGQLPGTESQLPPD